MLLTAHQPAYLPWLGYFEKIYRADVFVYLDSVQFEKNSFTNRNKIKTPQGELWLTVPVHGKGHFSNTIENLAIDSSRNWKQKHLGAIYTNYKRARAFPQLFPAIEALYANEHQFLADLCYEQLQFWLKQIGLNRKIVKSSTLDINSCKSQFVIDICRNQGASSYLSGVQGHNYLKASDFTMAGIELDFQDYQHPEYSQLWGSFVPRLSIIDFLMNGNDPALIWGKQ